MFKLAKKLSLVIKPTIKMLNDKLNLIIVKEIVKNCGNTKMKLKIKL